MTYYQSLLKDQRWYDKRKTIIERDGFQCTKCGLNQELQVHHIKYIWGIKPWEYEDKYLITLCSSCHTRVNEPTSQGGLKSALELAQLSLQSLIERRSLLNKKL